MFNKYQYILYETLHALSLSLSTYTGCFIMFSVITNIYNKKTKGATLMELFTPKGKLIFFDNYRCSVCAPRVTRQTSIRYSCSCHTLVYMGASCLHKYQVSVHFLYHARMVLIKASSLFVLQEIHFAQ